MGAAAVSGEVPSSPIIRPRGTETPFRCGATLEYRNPAQHVNVRGLAVSNTGFAKPGDPRCVIKPYLDYFKPDFHPWQNDNRALLKQWKARYDQWEMDEMALAA